MRDDDQRAVEGGEEALEPREAVAVEVVGGLVEQQDVGVAEQRGGQQRAGLLAAGEALERAVARQVLDGEAPAGLLGARLGGPGAGRLGALEGVAVGVEVAAGSCERRVERRRPASPSGVAEQVVERARRGASCGR